MKRAASSDGPTRDAWQRALSQERQAEKKRQSAAHTAEELSVLWACSMSTVNRRIRRLIQAGMATVTVRSTVGTRLGYHQMVPAYHLWIDPTKAKAWRSRFSR